MLFSISWRNVWRNKLRSAIMLVSIALGITAGIFMTAFYKGMADQRIDKVIRTELSHIQIHENEFRKNSDINKFIPDAFQISASIRKMDNVAGVSNRLIIYSMVASAETSAGIKISGIIPEEEMKVTNLQEKIVEGSYLNPGKKNPVLMSRKLALKLKVKPGSKVIITMQDVNNNIISGAFRITGLFDTRSTLYDEANIFVLYDDLAKLMNSPSSAAHEIAVRAASNEQVSKLVSYLAAEYKGLEILPWTELSPELGYLTEAMDFMMYVFILIILLALLFGLVNTMLMVVLERIKEIGMLMAVGMNKVRIFLMIMLESVFLTLSGGFAGVITGALISLYFETHKIDLSLTFPNSGVGTAYEDLGYDSFVYTSIDIGLLINVTWLVLLTGIIGSLYPAYRALQNNPSEALRIE
jgi:putative ABC transport system permease protein